MSVLDDSVKRCSRCGWPLVERVEDGCTGGNCSMRPMPKELVHQETGTRRDIATEIADWLWAQGKVKGAMFPVDRRDCLMAAAHEVQRLFGRDARLTWIRYSDGTWYYRGVGTVMKRGDEWWGIAGIFVTDETPATVGPYATAKEARYALMKSVQGSAR